MRRLHLTFLAVISCASHAPAPKAEVSVDPIACPEGSSWNGQLCQRTAKTEPPPAPPPITTTGFWNPPALRTEDVAAARRHFAEGAKLYGAGDFAGALAEFETAWAFKSASAVLYNIAITFERLGRDDEALDVYERFLATNPPQAGEVQKRINALRKH